MHKKLLLPTLLAMAAALAACGNETTLNNSTAPNESANLTPSEAGPAPVPVDGLTAAQLERFEQGRALFEKVFTPTNGLGPVFNGQSCAECHAQPYAGGTSATHKVTRFTTPLTPHFAVGLASQVLGAPHIHSRSVADEFPQEVPGCVLAAESLPDLTIASTERVTPSLLGIGLLEAITDSTLIDNGLRTTQRNPEITGRPGLLVPGGVNDFSSGDQLVGRIGARGFVGDVTAFTQGAFHTELGISTLHPVFAAPVMPQGQMAPADCVPFAGMPVSLEEIALVVDFQRWLAPPAQPVLDESGLRGRAIFDNIGCADCHTPSLPTSQNAPEPLGGKQVHLYSDLLLHDLGEGLADNAPEGLGLPGEWRTAPLWGVGQFDKPLMHDGRAGRDFAKAITLHGGEATGAVDNYKQLSEDEKQDLEGFLKAL